MQRALTFRASSIGDCLMGVYFLSNIHAAYPSARCGLVVASRGAMIRELCAAYPWIEVIEASRRDVRSLFRLWKKWKGSDVVLTQYAGKPGGMFSLPSKLAARILARRGGSMGFEDAFWGNRYIYGTLLPCDRDAAPAALERSALVACTVPIAYPYPRLDAVVQEGVLERFGLSQNSFVMVHLFSGSRERGLHPTRMRALVAAVRAVFPQLRIVLTGGAADRSEATAIAQSVSNALSIAGDVSLQELLSVIDTAHTIVSVDTGVAHMAAQRERHVIVCTSCIGKHWWQDAQYGAGRATIGCNLAYCTSGSMTLEPYPRALNEIDFVALLQSYVAQHP